jgi:hypothetical protein
LLGWDEEWNVEDHSQGGQPGATTAKTSSESHDAMPGKPAVLAKSRRPAILTYRSWVIEHAHRLLRLPLYLIGWHTESETIEVGMMEAVEFEKGARNVPSSLRLELRSKQPLEVYRVAVHFSAKLEGLRWLMYQYRLTSLIAFTSLFWSVEMGVVLLTWAVFTMLFGSSALKEEEDTTTSKKIKTEPDDASLKLERTESTPGTPLSDTSRTFPTLHSQQPLHYSSPSSPKDERQSPALEDIPMREDAEADDEDDDFVLEEPLPRNVEREALFTDSGIGTSFEGERERERSVQRRKSGKVKDERG